jgi:ATP-dependent helicase/nuclease subunit A
MLYVAMTRARQALFVSGVASRRGGWLERLKPAHDQVAWDSLPAMTWRESSASSAPPPGPPAVRATCPAIGARRTTGADRDTPQTRHGSLLHAWLERRLQCWSEADLRARLGEDPVVAAQARTLLAIPELAPAFDPGRHRRAHNEMECLDAQGRLLRMDRVVEFDDQVWVLDYKSGSLEQPDPERRADPYRAQMADYRAALAPLYAPRPVRCVLAFADGMVVWL